VRGFSRLATVALFLCLAWVGAAQAADIPVSGEITVSTTWTADNTYDLQDQVFVMPGVTLTIEPGTVISSTPTPNGAGSLAITKGATIIANGTKKDPIIMTSKNDDFVTWREAASEWGNLSILGGAFISEDAVPGNVPTCDPGNFAVLEGLVASGPEDTRVRYGGGDDDDDSGSVCYVSIRYGGRVVGLANELNGLSLGGVGRGTDLHHIEIMNNVDDGIEIFGGTCNIKYFSIWNIGDDSFDVDQGWRGQAQFGLIVQGYSTDNSQGSGVGDNCFETDGAEDSDFQPVTSSAIYNCTVIGQPLDGDGGTAWRDNARIQYRSCIFMDLGERLVRFDDIDGDGANGYGHNNTLSWEETWTTDVGSVPPHPNDCPNPGERYQAQLTGKLAEIRDSIFYRNLAGNAYDEAILRGVLPPDATNKNIRIDDPDPALAPIKNIERADPVVRGGKQMVRVTKLDPRPQNEALENCLPPQADEAWLLCAANFRGAFDPACPNWLVDWTASFAYGFTPDKLLCFDMKRDPSGNVVAQLVIKKNPPRTATIVQNGTVLCMDAPITITQQNPLTATFNCGGPTVTVKKQGGLKWEAGPFTGTLCPIP